MTAHQSHQSLEQLQREVLQVFAEVTRYPSDILDPEAGLEEELGIDSVKLGEIFSVLRERYALPEKLEVEPDQIQNIRGVSRMLHGYLGALPVAPRHPICHRSRSSEVDGGNAAEPSEPLKGIKK